MLHAIPLSVLELSSSQTTPTQTHLEGSLQSELMQVHAGSPHSPPIEPEATPPSTVDTTALSEDPIPGKREREGLRDTSSPCAAHFLSSVRFIEFFFLVFCSKGVLYPFSFFDRAQDKQRSNVFTKCPVFHFLYNASPAVTMNAFTLINLFVESRSN